MTIIVSRFICALVLHMQLEGKVLQGMQFIKFAIFKITSWRKRFPMLLVSMMQLCVAITFEVLMIIQICSTNKISEIILSFIMFGIIAEIDYWFSQTIQYRFFMRLLKESEIVIQPTEEDI